MSRNIRPLEPLELVALFVAVAGTLFVCGSGQLGALGASAILIGSFAAIWLGTRENLSLPRWLIWSAAIVLAIVACVRSPFGSHDLWSYAMYGRILEFHHANPYHSVPALFQGDPVLHMVGKGWRHTPSAYGPLFIGYAATIARFSGSRLTLLRLGFQIPAAMAVLGAGWIAQRVAESRGVGTRVLAVALLQPFVWCSIVNGGHNDVWVAIGAVAAVCLVDRQRAGIAGAVIGAVALVKITALLAVPAIALALIARRDFRRGFALCAAAGSVTLVGTVLAPASITTAAKATRGIVSRSSVWRLLVDVTHIAPRQATTLGLIVTVIAALSIAWFGRRSDYAITVALSLSAYGVLGSYVLPWYAIWALPVAAALLSRSIGALVAAHGSLLFAAYEVGRSSDTRHFAGGILVAAVPALTVAAYGVITVLSLRHRRKFTPPS
ncbi:MAG: glycosyltransferase 87 family protein [Actinomycetes bacterium]